MKYFTKLLVTVISLQLLFVVFGFSQPHNSAIAVEEPMAATMTDLRVEMATPGSDVDPQIKQKSDYLLPYPGILQNHPLYFLKELRDKIIETLIVDPLRKSEFYLLQSDKWIASVPLLIEQKDVETASRVVNQAADRMRMATEQLVKANANGREISGGMVLKLESAIEKHLEMTDELSIDGVVDPTESREVYLAAQEEIIQMKK